MHQRLLLISVILFSTQKEIWSAAILHTPRRVAPPDQAVDLAFSTNQVNVVAQAYLYVRKAGTVAYQQILMTGSGIRYRGQVPRFLVQPPGVEYFIEVRDQQGVLTTYPPQNARGQPVRMQVSTEVSKPAIQVVYPKPGQIIAEKRPRISVVFRSRLNPIDIDSAQMYLNGMQVTSNMKKKGNFASYRPPLDLNVGKHRVEVLVKDISGNSAEPARFEFQVAASQDDIDRQQQQEEEKWETTGNLSTQYQYSKVFSQAGGGSQVAYPNGYATMSFDFKAKRADEEIFLGPVFFTTQQTESPEPAQNFSFGYSNNYVETRWGNASVSLTELSGGGAILGGDVAVYTSKKQDKEGFRFQASGGRTRQGIEGDAENFNVGTYAQRMLGGKVDYYINKEITVYGAVMDVRDIEDSINNPGETQPLQNQAGAAGFQISRSLWILDSFNGEVGYSQAVLTDTSDSSQTQQFQDAAWKFSTSRQVKKISTTFNVNYSEYRPEFLFLYGGAGSDLRSLGYTSSSTFMNNVLNLSTGYTWSRTNLESQNVTTTFTNAANANLGINIKNWPSISIGENFTLQEVVGQADQESTNINNAANLNISWGYKLLSRQHNSTLGASVSTGRNTTVAAVTTSLNQSYSLAHSINKLFSWLAFSMNYSFTISETSENPVKGLSDNIALNITPTITDIQLSLPLGVTVSRSFDDQNPHQTDNMNVAFSLSANYTLAQKHSFSLSTGYTIFEDFLTPDSNYQQFTLTFAYNTTL